MLNYSHGLNLCLFNFSNDGNLILSISLPIFQNLELMVLQFKEGTVTSDLEGYIDILLNTCHMIYFDTVDTPMENAKCEKKHKKMGLWSTEAEYIGITVANCFFKGFEIWDH